MYRAFLLLAVVHVKVLSAEPIDLTPPSSGGKGVTAEMANWLSSVSTPGRINNKLVSHQFGLMGAGFLAGEDVNENETLVEIPMDAVMSQRSAYNSRLKPFLDASPMDSFAVLVLHLMFEASLPDSVFRAYIDTLPQAVDLPLSWSEEEMGQLNGTQLLPYVKQQQASVKQDYDTLVQSLLAKHPLLFPAESFNLERFIWATSIVMSRSFLFNIGGALHPVLVPVADVFNLKSDAETLISTDPSGALFQIHTKQPFKKGEQVFISLGHKSTFHLLSNYGYADPDNAMDSISVRMRLDPEDPFVDMKEKMLAKLGVRSGGSATVTKSKDDVTIPNDLLAFTKVQVLKPRDFDQFLDIAEGKPVSLRNQLDSLRKLMVFFSRLLANAPTTVQEDGDTLMREGGLAKRTAFAIAYRRNENIVLHEAMKKVASMWESMLLQGVDDKLT